MEHHQFIDYYRGSNLAGLYRARNDEMTSRRPTWRRP
jgi:hypothetical protein